MSRVKKAVLFILVVFTLVLITMPAHGKGSAKFGLTQINSDSTTLSASIDQTWDNPIIDLVIETDYVYAMKIEENKIKHITKIWYLNI